MNTRALNKKGIFFLATILLIMFNGLAQDIKLVKLKTERKENPVGIDVIHPAFSWQVQAKQRGFIQSAYQLMMADDSVVLASGVANIWSSKKKISSTSTGIFFHKHNLKSSTKYFWKVRVWDKKGAASDWSTIASFTTSLLKTSDWDQAQWIGFEDLPDSALLVPGVHNPDAKALGNRMKQRTVVPLFRTEFQANKKIEKALMFISGLGQYEASINGHEMGNSFLAPGWTHYNKRVLYNTYDITGQIRTGANAIGVMVGNGFYNINRERYYKLTIAYGLPKMICKIYLRFSDGSTRTIVSDEAWKTSASPITFTSIFGGEDYDANLEQKGWNEPGFDDRNWRPALEVKAPAGKLESEKDYPVTVSEVLPAKKINRPMQGLSVYDFGQNASGIIEISLKGQKGQVVKLWPGELLKDSGNINQSATGRPYYFSYTLKGDGVETWRPKFTYYGFRYVQVEGALPLQNGDTSHLPKILSLNFLHTRNSTPATGSFQSSNLLFNRIDSLIRWAIKSNLQSVVTDCPHREKLSWLEQDYLMGGSIQSNFEVYHLYKKLVHDMMDAQTKEGLIPDIAPEFVFFDDNGFGFRDSPEWGSASVIVPWLIYKWYGDKEIMRIAYPMMKKYVAYLKSKANNHILSYGLGDWFDYGPKRPGVAQLTPKELTATAIYFHDVQLMAQMSLLLKFKKEAVYYKTLAGEIKKAFNEKFFDKNSKSYATGSQTSMAMPLCVGLVVEEFRKPVIANLIDSIKASGKKLTAGDIGFHFLVQALHEGGASQLLYEMNYRDDVPGYGYQIKKGATALTESWPALEVVSNNHLMLGHIMEWFYTGLAGVNQTANSVGYKEIMIRPEVVGDLTNVKASYESNYGTIVSEWNKQKDRLFVKASIPANTSAIIYLPALPGKKIWEKEVLLESKKEITNEGYEGERLLLRVGSGDYEFSIEQ